MDGKLKINQLIIGIVILIIVLVGAGIWYWQSKKLVPAPAVTGHAGTVAVPVTQEAAGSIGSVIVEKTQNPLQDKLPETNPLKKVIKNPF